MPVAAPLIGAAGSIGAAALSKPKKGKDPNAYLAPYLNQGAQAAQGLFNQGGPQVYDGSTVAGPSDATRAALDAQVSRGLNGSPLIDQAQGVVQQGLQTPIQTMFGDAQNPYAQSVGGGSGFNPYSRSVGGGAQFDPYAGSVGGGAQYNPYASGQNPFGQGQNPGLDQAFNYAAQKSQNVLDSEYARSGRNTDAAAPARADMLSSLAAQIYAPAYESERNRQLQYGQQQLGIGAQGFEDAQTRNQTAALQGQQIGSQGFQAGQQRNLQAGLAGQQIGAGSFNDAQGRNLSANLNAQNIGAQGFENNQNRALQDINSQRQQQLGLLGFSTPLAAQDYLDLQQARDAGGAYDQFNQAQLSDTVNRFNQQQQQPYNNLQTYLANLNGLKSATGPAQQPVQPPNYLSAGLGGALLGSQLFPQKTPQPYAGNPNEIAQGQALGLWG